MTQRTSKQKKTLPSQTRTDKDKTMIVLGVLLIVLFILFIYFSVGSQTFEPGRKSKGPVRNPHGSLKRLHPEISLSEHAFGGIENLLKRRYV